MKRNKNTRSRCFCFVLYPDDKDHQNIFDFVLSNYNYAFILHNCDKYHQDEFDEDNNLIHQKGELKKPHYHFIIDFPNPRSLNSIRNQLRLDYIETCNFYFYTRYLIHLDDPQKHQYLKREIKTNMLQRVSLALDREFTKENLDSKIIYNWIIKNHYSKNFKQLTDFCFENNLVSELKNNVYFYKNLCN